MNDFASQTTVPDAITVTAPCRLHFGLLRVGDGPRQFGGAGLMLASPRLRIAATLAERFTASGELADRLEQFADDWSGFHGVAKPPLQLEVREAPPQHSGLGVGTQLGLSVAAALNAYAGIANGDPATLARSVRRGRRSAVGAYGFHFGGLIIERGKSASETISPLDLQVALPATWRFVLVRPAAFETPVFGNDEQAVFDRLTSQPALEQKLERLLRNELAPSATSGDFDWFADTVETYGRLAGSYFATAQGGPYNGPVLNRLVAGLKSLGAQGVGQSSWGPTIFTCHASASAADQFVDQLSQLDDCGPLEIEQSSVCESGASVLVSPGFSRHTNR